MKIISKKTEREIATALTDLRETAGRAMELVQRLERENAELRAATATAITLRDVPMVSKYVH